MKRLPVSIIIVLTLSPMAQANSDYSLKRSGKADTERWQCEPCSSDSTWHGNIEFGLGYLENDNGARFNNWTPPVYGTHSSDKRINPSFNARFEQYEDSGYYNRITALDLGLQRFLIEWETGHYDGLRLLGSYRETPYYAGYSWLSAYQDNGDSLSSGSVSSFHPGTTRETATLKVKYTPYSPWQPHVSMKHERKHGTHAVYTFNSPGIGNGPGFIPKAIEHETLSTDFGVSYLEEDWMADLSYHGSFFRNDKPALYFGPQTHPYQNQIAYEPDNDFHQLALSGNYRLDNQTLNSRLLWSHNSSESGMNPFPQAPAITQQFHGEVNTLQLSVDYHNRLSTRTALKIGADYLDRDDDSDRHTIIGSTRTDYDRDKTRLDARVDQKLNRSLRLQLGYDYTRDRRPYADRTTTKEQRVYADARYRPQADWALGGKLSFALRDGSEWNHSHTDSARLRQYYLADRDRIELRGDGSVQFSPQVQLVLEVWYADDEYPTPDIGISDGEDYGYDASVNFSLDNGVNGHVFINQQYIRTEQHHANSDVLGWNRYTSTSRDDITTVGFGVSKDDLLKDTLQISFDYTHSRSHGATRTSPVGYDYPDNRVKSHRFELTGDYQLSEAQNVLLNIRYERYAESDYLFDQDLNTMGDVTQSYDGLFGAIYWRYHF